jgi:hypothetical protein
MTRWLQVALVASLLFAGCGTAPTVPTPAATPAPLPSAVVPTILIVTFSTMPFHVGTPGDVHYEVTGVNALASLAYASTDGSTNRHGAHDVRARGHLYSDVNSDDDTGNGASGKRCRDCRRVMQPIQTAQCATGTKAADLACWFKTKTVGEVLQMPLWRRTSPNDWRFVSSPYLLRDPPTNEAR